MKPDNALSGAQDMQRRKAG